MAAAYDHCPSVIVDVDTGLDDALALIYLTRSKRLRLLGVTCVAGNTSVDQVMSNTLRVLSTAGAAEDLPVARGAERPLINDLRTAHGFHGSSGLGDVSVPATSRLAAEQSALELMRDLVESSPTPVTLLGLGPMTNIALFIRAFPALSPRLERIVVMGGAINAANATPVAEFNAWHDPEALSIVVHSGVPTTLYTLDVFLKPSVAPAVVAELASSADPGTALVGQLLGSYGRDGGEQGGACGLGDAGAACLLSDSSLGEVSRFPVGVELTGLSRGQTLVDRRLGPGEAELHGAQRVLEPVDVVTGIDAVRASELFVAVVRQAT